MTARPTSGESRYPLDGDGRYVAPYFLELHFERTELGDLRACAEVHCQLCATVFDASDRRLLARLETHSRKYHQPHKRRPSGPDHHQ
jgi:hypothetical protein